MATIFGNGQRTVNGTSRRDDRHAGALQGTQSRSRPMIIALLTVSAMAAMIGTGVVVGKNTLGAADVSPPPRPLTVAPRPAPTPTPRIEGGTLAPMALPPEALPDAMVTAAAPIDVPATAPTVADRPVQASTASAPPGLATRNAGGNGERADVSFRRNPRVVQDQAASPPATIIAGRRVDCYSDADCTNVRLYAADGDVARAYAEATSSGVRVRDLRDYRSEWIRARNVAEDRPREALRIYDMVAADLRTLTDDAVADDRTQ